MLRDTTYNRIHLQRAANELAEYRRLQHYRPRLSRDGVTRTLDEVLADYPVFRYFEPHDFVGVWTDNTQQTNYVERQSTPYTVSALAQAPVWLESGGYNGRACIHFGVDTSGAPAFTQFFNPNSSNKINGDFTIISLFKVDADYLTSGERQPITGNVTFANADGEWFGFGAGSNNENSTIYANRTGNPPPPNFIKKSSTPISAAVSEWAVLAMTNDAIYKNGVEIAYSQNDAFTDCNIFAWGGNNTFYPPEKFKGKSGPLIAISQKLTQPQIQEIADLILAQTP